MSHIFYDIFLELYYFAAILLSPFNPKAKKWTDGRKHIWHELENLGDSQRKRIWFHCSSLGEYEQALPLIEKLQDTSEIIITFFSPSGYEVARRKNPDRKIFYLPHDSKSNARHLIEKIHPELAVFIRYDLWYYYLNELRHRQIPTILISGVFRVSDIYFQWYGKFFLNMLKCFHHIFVQDENSRTILLKQGFTAVTKAGDTRVDRVAATRVSAPTFPIIEQFKSGKKILIIGSLEPEDEHIILPLVNDIVAFNHFKFIIAPHNVSISYLTQLQRKISKKSILFSKTNTGNANEHDILIIDGIGLLSSVYRYADIVYIGGGFGEGLHNVLEPAAWGKPVLFGPCNQKFIEAAELINKGGAFEVNSPESLKQQVIRIASDENALRTSGSRAVDYIREHRGATSLIYNWIAQNTMMEK